MFENLQTDETIQGEKDTLGGFAALDSNAYDMVIELAYLDISKGGAMGFVAQFKDSQGNSLRITEWMTSGTAKGTKNFYMDRNDNKQYLPGFINANAICLLTVGKEVAAMEPEDKTINVYNPELGKEAPTQKKVYTQLIGQPVTLGVLKQIINKTEKDGAGAYVPTNEQRIENVINKVFRTKDRMTTTEIIAQATEAEFFQKWVDKNKGNTVDRFKEVANAPVHAQSGQVTQASGPAPTQSLFS